MPEEFSIRNLAWRGMASYAAHAFKAVAKQHHTEMLPVLRRAIPVGGTVIDGGSHAGQFAKLFAKLASPGRVYAFEPSSYARSILEMAVKLRRIGNIEVVASGLSDAPGRLRLVTPMKKQGTFRYGLAHLAPVEGNAEGGDFAIEEVPLTTVDAFVAERGLDRLDFIKVDVEGWEGRVLQGAARAIERWHPALLLELQNNHLVRAGDNLKDTWAMLEAWDYRPFLWKGGDILEPLAEPRDGDVFWFLNNPR